MKSNKCFIIGLSKTGTSSVEAALNVLGYKLGKGLPINGDDPISVNWDKLDKMDGGSDTPAAMFYKELSDRYPTARFILTTRSKPSWLKSCEVHFSRQAGERYQNNLREYHYGVRVFDRERFSAAYDRHVEGVRQHFQGSGRLLEVDLVQNPRWAEICEFLQEPVPSEPFPHENKTSFVNKLKGRLKRLAQS